MKLDHRPRNAPRLPAPQAILFDVDDTLVDVTRSYRAATIATAKTYEVSLSQEDICAAKAAGDANDDWKLTWDLIRQRGIDVDFEEVRQRFERFYQGDQPGAGFKLLERLLIDTRLLDRLGQRVKLGLVTGRPARDAQEFLMTHGLQNRFGAVVTMDDAPLKPDPAPVRLAMSILGVAVGWLVGDTPDDMRAAFAAGVVPLGVAAPVERPQRASQVLREAGAVLVLQHLSQLESLLDGAVS